MKRTGVLLILAMLACGISRAQTQTEKQMKYSVVTNSFWSNWYVQAGLDMSLQNPYGHKFSKVFPNGKTFGVHAALGRWFTPGLGLRGRVNWENGIGLFENKHAEWLAPFYNPGVNMDKGGYICVVGDIQFDIHNLFFGYDSSRMWNLQLYPRAGMAYNFGVSKGTPLIGIGVGNTFRINDRYKICFDVTYNGVSSGFVGVEKSTGVDNSNSNGFFDINVGIQINLGQSTFRKTSEAK